MAEFWMTSGQRRLKSRRRSASGIDSHGRAATKRRKDSWFMSVGDAEPYPPHPLRVQELNREQEGNDHPPHRFALSVPAFPRKKPPAKKASPNRAPARAKSMPNLQNRRVPTFISDSRSGQPSTSYMHSETASLGLPAAHGAPSYGAVYPMYMPPPPPYYSGHPGMYPTYPPSQRYYDYYGGYAPEVMSYPVRPHPHYPPPLQRAREYAEHSFEAKWGDKAPASQPRASTRHSVGQSVSRREQYLELPGYPSAYGPPPPRYHPPPPEGQPILPKHSPVLLQKQHCEQFPSGPWEQSSPAARKEPLARPHPRDDGRGQSQIKPRHPQPNINSPKILHPNCRRFENYVDGAVSNQAALSEPSSPKDAGVPLFQKHRTGDRDRGLELFKNRTPRDILVATQVVAAPAPDPDGGLERFQRGRDAHPGRGAAEDVPAIDSEVEGDQDIPQFRSKTSATQEQRQPSSGADPSRPDWDTRVHASAKFRALPNESKPAPVIYRMLGQESEENTGSSLVRDKENAPAADDKPVVQNPYQLSQPEPNPFQDNLFSLPDDEDACHSSCGAPFTQSTALSRNPGGWTKPFTQPSDDGWGNPLIR